MQSRMISIAITFLAIASILFLDSEWSIYGNTRSSANIYTTIYYTTTQYQFAMLQTHWPLRSGENQRVRHSLLQILPYIEYHAVSRYIASTVVPQRAHLTANRNVMSLETEQEAIVTVMSTVVCCFTAESIITGMLQVEVLFHLNLQNVVSFQHVLWRCGVYVAGTHIVATLAKL